MKNMEMLHQRKRAKKMKCSNHRTTKAITLDIVGK